MAVMMTPRETWTDERLDDLNKKVDEGFARLDGDMRELRSEVKGLRSDMNNQVKGLRSDMNNQVNGLRGDMNNQVNGLRGDMNNQVNGLRGEINDLRCEMNERFESLNHTLIGAAAVIVAAVIGSSAF